MKKEFLFLFITIVAVNLTAQIFNFEFFQNWSKPFIILSLGLAVLPHFKAHPKLLIGLFLSWIGDVLLIFQGANELFFIGGLVAFLTAHLFYISIFSQAINKQHFRFSFTTLLFPVYAGLLFWFLYPTLGEMKIPVIIYALVICTMGISAVLRNDVSNKNYFIGVNGALLFIASDSVLAVNKFAQPLPYAGFLIMATYCAAQFLIVKAVTEEKKLSLTAS
jgi:uncharacterized membrane protein YhhN